MPTTFRTTRGSEVTTLTYDVRVLRDPSSTKDKPVPAYWLVKCDPTNGWMKFVARFVDEDAATSVSMCLNWMETFVEGNVALDELFSATSVRISNLFAEAAHALSDAKNYTESIISGDTDRYNTVEEYANIVAFPTTEGGYL